MADASTTKSAVLLRGCTLAAHPRAGTCGWCGAALAGRRTAWCSDRCGEAFWRNHWWSLARAAAKRRDRRRCVRCGDAPPPRPSVRRYAARADYLAAMRVWRQTRRTHRLEVNHIVPCAGAHGTLSCAHHLENLETLCGACHRVHTATLAGERRRAAG